MTGKTINPRTMDRMPGWFSWRHQTNAAHVAAREQYLSEHGPVARRVRAAARLKSSPAVDASYPQASPVGATRVRGAL